MQGIGQHVLVTGGAGFIGSHIVDGLLRTGWRVTVVDDLSGGDRASVPPEARLIEADITRDDRAVASVFTGERYAAIVHCAAQTAVPRSVADPAHDRAVNLVGTEHLLHFARETAVGKFVFFSSGGAVYGDTTARADETTLPAPLSPYGVHKLAAEFYVALSGVPYAILRPANVFGPRQRAGTDGGVVAIFVERLRRGLPLMIHGDGHQVRDFVYVADVADAARAAITLPDSGLWNIASGTETTVNALAQTIAAELGITPALAYAPARAGDVYFSRLSNDKIIGEGWWQPRYTLARGITAMLDASGGDASPNAIRAALTH